MTLLGFLDLLVLTIHIVVCLFLVGIVLIQGGKGASLSASFGMGGASASAFGARTDSFMTKLTSGAAIAFVVTSILLTFFASRTGSLSQTINVEERPVPGASVPAEITPAAEPAAGTEGATSGAASETAPAAP